MRYKFFFFHLQAQERMSLNSLKQQRRSGRQFETTRETTIARHHITEQTEPLAFRELKEAPSANQLINQSFRRRSLLPRHLISIQRPLTLGYYIFEKRRRFSAGVLVFFLGAV